MQPCNADAQLQRPAAGWQNKEAAHTHTHTHPPHTHLLHTHSQWREQKPNLDKRVRVGGLIGVAACIICDLWAPCWQWEEEVGEGADSGMGKQL